MGIAGIIPPEMKKKEKKNKKNAPRAPPVCPLVSDLVSSFASINFRSLIAPH